MSSNKNYIKWKDWKSESFSKTSRLEEAYFNNILKVLELKKHSRILEVGFGNGSFLGYARRKNFECEGVELNQNLFELALNNNFSVYKSIKDINTNQRFDLIVLFDVVEHIPEEMIEGFFRDLSYYLEDQGSILLRFPNGSSPLGLANQHGDITHCNIVTLPKINYWCSKSSLEVVFSRGDVLPFIFRHNLFKMPSRLLRRLLYSITERFIRFISPQSKGIMSSNLQVIIKKLL